MGRTSQIRVGKHLYHMRGFQTYNFRTETAQEAAIWRADKPNKPGQSYKAIKDTMNQHIDTIIGKKFPIPNRKNDIQHNREINQEVYIKLLEEYRDRVKPMIVTEDYRTRGFMEEYNNYYDRFENELATILNYNDNFYDRQEKARDPFEFGLSKMDESLIIELKKIVEKYTTKLPFAGEGGKDKARREMLNKKETVTIPAGRLPGQPSVSPGRQYDGK